MRTPELRPDEERLAAILEVLSSIDDRRPERRKVGRGLAGTSLFLLPALAAGPVFGGYMWWFTGMAAPLLGWGLRKWLRLRRADAEDRERLTELGWTEDAPGRPGPEG